MNNKIVIIGCGNVGMSYAYALLNQKTKVNEIVLIDLNEKRIIGEAMDLNHGSSFSPSKIKIKAGNYADCNDATIICICAGVNQLENETRLDLLNKNQIVFKDIMNNIKATKFNGILLIATNPVDIMTYIAYKYSSFSKEKVIGSGTTLDTARLRYLLGEKLELNPKNIHTYVIGEHGDSEFVSWSNAYVGSIKLEKILSKEELVKIEDHVKKAAYEIIEKKGSTYYAIGMVLVRITNSILDDENSILTVSTYNEKNNVFIGYPSVINRNGISKILNISLTDEENNKFINSSNILRKEIDNLNL